MTQTRNNTTVPGGTVAYILKGYPRLSELFITSEIYRLEQLGVPLRLYVIKPAAEAQSHGLIARIKARPQYLPATTSLSATPLRRWLALHLSDFLPSVRRVARHRPAGLARAAAAACAQALRARRGLRPRKVYLKEFLQAAAIADRVLAAKDVRHLHAHFCHGATTVAWLAAMMTGLPFSCTAHAKDIYCAALNPAGLLRRKLRAARFVVTCTDANRAHLERIEPRAKVHCIYHGLNAEFTSLLDRKTAVELTQPAPPALPPTRLRALGVGRLVEKKGFDVLVEACGILRGQGVAVEAVIVGESGAHEAEIRRRIAALGLAAHVRLKGPMEQARLYEEYGRASAFCLPCRVLEDGDRDGIPNVLVEAMACGVPVITTNVSGIPEVVRDGVNGQLVPPDDPQALAAALLRCAREPQFAERLAHAGRATVRERFDGDAHAAQLAALFREVM
jgi:glycosyltransferase involved in cell wall biosynthesis